MTTVKPDTAPDAVGQRLIDEAGRLLAQHGVDGLSLRRVAQAAGTSTMSVYTRFGSKALLLAAMYREGFRRLGEALAGAATDTDAVSAGDLLALRENGRAYRRAAVASPALYALMFGPLPVGFRPSVEDGAAAEATYQPLVDGVDAAVRAGVLVGDPVRIAMHLWTVAHGTVGLELAGMLGDVADPGEHFDDALTFAVLPFLAPDASGREVSSVNG